LKKAELTTLLHSNGDGNNEGNHKADFFHFPAISISILFAGNCKAGSESDRC